MHDVDNRPSPSNDVDNGEQRALARFGRRILVDALSGALPLPAGFAPPPEEQARIRAVGVAAIGAAFAEDAAHDDDGAPASGPPPGWQERVLDKIEEIEARGPVSQQRPRRPSHESTLSSKRPAPEPLQRDVLRLPSELVARIDRRASEASALLGCEVPREAVAAWIRATDTRPISVELAAIDQALRPTTALDPHSQGWPKAMALLLDLIANTAARAFACEVSRSAVVGAALASWLEDAEHTRPKEVTAEEIRAVLATHEKQVEHDVPRLGGAEPARGDRVMAEKSGEALEEASLHGYAVVLPQAMIGRLDALARKAARLTKCDVTRATLFRAALLHWLARVDHASPSDTLQEIYKAAPLVGTRLHRCKPTWSKALNRRLDGIGARLGVKLSHCAAGARSALILTALRSWLPAAEDEPLKALDAIRAGLVKRGRKPTFVGESELSRSTS